MSGLAIRPGAEGDIEEVVKLRERSKLTRPWNDPYTDYRLALATPISTVLVGHAGDAPIAAVMTGFDGHRGWIYYLAVEPSRRKEGHGRAMMEAAEGWLRSRGSPTVFRSSRAFLCKAHAGCSPRKHAVM